MKEIDKCEMCGELIIEPTITSIYCKECEEEAWTD